MCKLHVLVSGLGCVTQAPEGEAERFEMPLGSKRPCDLKESGSSTWTDKPVVGAPALDPLEPVEIDA